MQDETVLHIALFLFGVLFGAACTRLVDHVKDIIETKRLERAEKGKK